MHEWCYILFLAFAAHHIWLSSHFRVESSLTSKSTCLFKVMRLTKIYDTTIKCNGYKEPRTAFRMRCVSITKKTEIQICIMHNWFTVVLLLVLHIYFCPFLYEISRIHKSLKTFITTIGIKVHGTFNTYFTRQTGLEPITGQTKFHFHSRGSFCLRDIPYCEP